MSDITDQQAIYDELQQKLASANASAEASEVHGVVCGLIATGNHLVDAWFAELFDQAEDGDLLVSDCRQQIHGLFDDTVKQIEGAGIGMQLLLPDDDAELSERARSVTLWCQGFLYGLGLAGSNLTDAFSDEVKEAMEDISAVSLMDFDSLAEDEDFDENEEALNEITEFLWVAAMLIRENILDASTPRDIKHEYH